ncbi:CDP-glycerol glycerophosphotransferase family protein [uncultured Bacteroides sp.]|uniref:CDP-glycerol glycerophosphotransferase family protein n=1 Tax=uncultured Bacteroides sp. TaxID=162156 RepID=UPI002602DE88|nr:CDP-glycerol glycerophosphotransferase family protein [uncultured Bacteroides sp.]
MIWYIKLAIIYCVRIGIRVFYLFPIKKNRILFSEYEGKTYKCSPKYIFEYMYRNWGDSYEYVWCIKDKTLIPAEYSVKCVKPLSLRHLYYLATSKIMMANIGIVPIAPPRKDRIFVNTWHGGGAYKKGGLSATYYSKPHMFYFKTLRHLRAKSTTYLISSCRRFSEIFADLFIINPDRILPIGMPRNDVFFLPANEQAAVREKICRQYGIDENAMIVLYAPTYRGHEHYCQHIDWTLDADAVCTAVKKRFGKQIVFLYRCHMNVFNDRQSISHAIDASDYPNMQELLLATDLLISDYSSLIWDFSFTYRPGFLYTPDLEEYIRVTKLHTPINQWQYPYAKTIDELCFQILRYDEEAAIARIKAHHQQLGSFENGTATKTLCEFLQSQMSDK